jgi:hypothetical protein
MRSPGEGKIRQVQHFSQRGTAKNESEDTGGRGGRGWLRIERETTREKALDGSALSQTTNSPQRRKLKVELKPHFSLGRRCRFEIRSGIGSR